MYIAIASIAIILFLYIYQFYYILSYNISNDPAVWGQLGDYAGGLLNPILSFLSLILLIKSLTLQNETNKALKEELRHNEKTEKLKMFETQFFNMLNSQNLAFDSFKIEVKKNSGIETKKSVEAIITIEEKIEELRRNQNSDIVIKKFLEKIDSSDQIFSATRRFYIMVQMISEKLCNMNGFSKGERRSHFLTLINFTDFSLLRLIMMSMQFLDYQSTQYLKDNHEFNSVLQELGINWNLY